MPDSSNCEQSCPGVKSSSYSFLAISIPSIKTPSSSFFTFRLLLYPRFLLIINKTRDSSSKEISSSAALARKRQVSNVVLFPCSERIVSSVIKPSSFKNSTNASRRNLYRCKLRRILLLRVLSAFVVILFPFSKFCVSSTVKGFTLTPNRMIDETSSSVSASFTNAHPILFVPKSKPKILFIVCYLYIFPNIKILFQKHLHASIPFHIFVILK